MTKRKANYPLSALDAEVMKAARGGFGAGQSSDGAANTPNNPPPPSGG